MYTTPNTMIYRENPRNTKILQDVYDWYDEDNGSIIIDWNVWYIEKSWGGAKYPSERIKKKMRQLMKKHFSCVYLYDLWKR